jgi:hypothetical protein
MTKKFYGIGTLDVVGNSQEFGYGYSKFVKLNINGKKYFPVLWSWPNFFGIDYNNRKGSLGRIKEENSFLRIGGKSNKENLNNSFIAGFPSIKIGTSPWGPKTGIDLGKLEDYKKLEIETKYEVKIKKGYANLTYDIWLTKKREGFPKKGDLEIMLWLKSNFLPPTPPYEILGETRDFLIKYKKSKNGQRLDFYLKGNKKNFTFDVIDLLKFSKKRVKSIKGYYLRSIELGTELSKNSEVEAKVYNIKIEAKTK